MAKPRPGDWLLTLRPLPDEPRGPTGIQRLRRLLKIMLRAYGIRAIAVEELEEERLQNDRT